MILCHTINTVRRLGHCPQFWNLKKAASEVAVRHVLQELNHTVHAYDKISLQIKLSHILLPYLNNTT